MSTPLFEIENMICSYTKNVEDKVLCVEHLVVPQKSITFFVGPSGIGKSTLLETLGFMNDTVCYPVEKFEYLGKDMSRIWDWSDKEKSSFRNSEFSFVFQQTNLMPNFTACENILVTALIQGMSKEKALELSNKILYELSFFDKTDRLSVEYSGGQQQRIAFARAILPAFRVLFGDEPTGNLDPETAKGLMDVLYKRLIEKSASAIIVSHDLQLAARYASTIVKIQKRVLSQEEEKYYGVINDECIYTRQGEKWLHQGKELSEVELLDYIK